MFIKSRRSTESKISLNNSLNFFGIALTKGRTITVGDRKNFGRREAAMWSHSHGTWGSGFFDGKAVGCPKQQL